MLMCLVKRLLFRVLENNENTLFNFPFYCLLVNVFTVTELSLVLAFYYIFFGVYIGKAFWDTWTCYSSSVRLTTTCRYTAQQTKMLYQILGSFNQELIKKLLGSERTCTIISLDCFLAYYYAKIVLSIKSQICKNSVYYLTGVPYVNLTNIFVPVFIIAISDVARESNAWFW